MEEIVKKVYARNPISEEESFLLAQEVSRKILRDDTFNDGLDIIIHIADNWNQIPEITKEIWGELIESVGFYPYLDKLGVSSIDLGYLLRKEFHHSDSLGKYLHEGQKELLDILFSGKNVIASAPTSFGKSLLIEEIVASGRYKNIVIIQPTLALLDETRQKLSKYKNKYKIIVRTSQLPDTVRGNIFLLTAERVLEYIDLPEIDFLILDEFYKLSNNRGDNRSSVLNNAFLKVMKNKNCQFYLLGPNIDDVSQEFKEHYNAEFYHTNYTLVSTEEINKYNEVSIRQGNKVDESDLFKILDKTEEQTLIFCASPSTARKLAFAYCRHLKDRGVESASNKVPLIDWIDENISWGWSLTNCLAYRIGVHDGAMPKHITTSTIRYFNDNKLTYLFCTNTIIEGVNTSAKNVIFYDNKIGNKDVDYFDYSNIRGRAGRLMEHYVGRIINLKRPPEKENISIDIPLIDQNPIESEVLVNLEKEDVKDIKDNKKRYNDFNSLDDELKTILKRNAVSIEGQLKIVSELERDINIPDKYALILWNRPDKELHNQMQYLLDLCWENLSNENERKSFGPKNWVRAKLVSVCYGDSIAKIIEDDISYNLKKLSDSVGFSYSSIGDIYKNYPDDSQLIIDRAIERAFSFQRNWQQYRAPKWINVVDSLQKYVCKKNNKIPGDYSYVADMIENSFIEQPLRILIEYGMPQNAVEIIQRLFMVQRIDLHEITEDQVLEILKNSMDVMKKLLGDYEFDILSGIL